MLPNSRDPWAFMRAVPGVQIDRVNQAGSESGQQSGFIGKGSSQTDAMWVLDGVVITDPAAVGASPTYFDFDAFDEVAITTGGADVRVATGGVGINLVTKRGTNAFHGGVSGFFANDDARGLEPALRPRGRPAPAGQRQGRPRRPDRGVRRRARRARSSRTGSGSGAPTGSRTCASMRLNQTKDKTLLKDYNAKLNLQVTSYEHALGLSGSWATRSSSAGRTTAGSAPRPRRTPATRATSSSRTPATRTAS